MTLSATARSFSAVVIALSISVPAAAASSNPTRAADGPRAAADQAGSEPRLGLILKPVAPNGGPAEALDIELRFDLPDGAFRPLVLPEVIGPLVHIADRILDVAAADDAGPLPLAMTSIERKDAEASSLGGRVRVWAPARPSKGIVTVRYRAEASREMTPGPSWEVRSERRGISGAGNTCLLLPEGGPGFLVRITWDLAAMPAGARSITSLPPDAADRPLSTDALRSTYFMAGDLIMTPEDGPFRAASTADTPYDQMELLKWTAAAYRSMLDFFGPPLEKTFTVMFRGSSISRASGTELPGALMATMMPGTPLDEVKLLASHEMVHVFMNGLAPDGWFEEGLAVFYQNRAPFVAGLIGEDAYIADVNATARTYYRNVRFGMPMKDAEAQFWTDARARLQLYVRGAMYLSLVDNDLRAATDGRRGLDDMMREFIARRNAGKSVALSDWLDIAARDLGPAVRSGCEAMLAGRKIILPSDAFGPGFRRVEEELPVFELGFDISSLMRQPRVIRGLDPKSPAAVAGLREGDLVARAVSLDEAQERYGRPLVLEVERGGGTAVISFLPYGRPAGCYRWERVKRPSSSPSPTSR